MNAAVRDDAPYAGAALRADGLRPDLNGRRFSPRKSSRTVFVVLWGRLCLVPDSHTYANLWDKTGGIGLLPHAALVPPGNPLSSGAHLASGTTSDELYLITNGFRYRVSPELVEQYAFSLAHKQTLPDAKLAAIPQGPDLTGPVT